MLRPSSRRGLTYADAVRFLGAGENQFLSYVGRLAGLPASAAALATLSSVDLLAARNEMVEWGQSAVRSLGERRAGLSRFDRTERLTAAHTVLVVSAFFESWPSSDGITLGEQAALGARSTSESTAAGVAEVLTKAAVPMPSAAVPPEALRLELEAYYSMLASASSRFLDGLAAPTPAAPGPTPSAPHSTPGISDKSVWTEAAVRRYEIGYRSLAAEVPEFAIWAAMTDAAAGRATTERMAADLAAGVGIVKTRVSGLATGLDGLATGVGEVATRVDGLASGVAEVETGLADIRAMLAGLTGAAETCRADLADQYRRELGRPIVDVGELPDGVTLPATADLYVNPRARARGAEQGSLVAAESWWEEAAGVSEIQSFLAGYLTGPNAVTAPLVVLGQPGSGKSMLTKVLAATLPPAEFLAVRVELRSVAADAPVQDQIEAAVHDTIGERVSWPELVRSAGGALPVVMLDGFDELLQASGANRADYLEQVRDFQRREADLGRPLAVLVTSRIVVADRARVPDGSVVLRLEPFTARQIETWLLVWETASTRSLTADVALRYRELAEQPLLLLMLAIYTAWGNDLREGGTLGRADLYERLFTDFARRELAKREPSEPIDEAAIAREIRRLEFVAIALFVRGAQVVTEQALDGDLCELLRDDHVAQPGRDRPLSAAQLLVGRFFFLHESRAREGVDQPERSFEFLHATFGEFLVARLVVSTLIDLAEERVHQAKRPHPSPVDAGPLQAWLSFAVLTASGPIIEFCRVMLSRLGEARRAECEVLVRETLRIAACPPSTWSFGDYQPVRRSASEREAAFTANLVTLLVLLSPSGIEPRSLGEAWRSQALLWESRLPADAWRSLWTALRMRWPMSDDEAPVLSLEDGSPVSLWQSMPWPSRLDNDTNTLFRDLSVPSMQKPSEWLREAAFRADAGMPLVLAHSAAPFWRVITAPVPAIRDMRSNGSNLEVLLEVLLAPRDADQVDHLLLAYKWAMLAFDYVEPGRVVIMRMLEDDARRLDPAVVLMALDRAVGVSNGSRRRLWLEHADGPARILAICYHRNGDREQIWMVYDGIGGHTKVNPGEQRFRDLLRQEFEILGVPFPEDLFT